MINKTVLNFDSFQKEFLNEGESYSVPGIKGTWDGGYIISPLDTTWDEIDEIPRDRIIIIKTNETSIALCYIDSDGDESDYIWVPKDACSIKKGSSGEITELNLEPYKKWISSPSNRNRIDDFIEEFADHLENSKTTGQEKIKTNAKDDVELLMDIIGIPGSIESFESCGDYIWDAKLDNGMLIEITKRSQDDLLSKFKIYLNANDHHPRVYINNNSDNKKTSFRIPGMEKSIDINKGFVGIRNSDPYIKYLTKRSMEIEDSSDKENLYKYFKSQIDQKSEDRETLKIVADLLSEFMDKREVEAMSPNLHHNS